MKNEHAIVTIESITAAYRRLERHARAFEAQLQRLEALTAQAHVNTRFLSAVTEAAAGHIASSGSLTNDRDEIDGGEVPPEWDQLSRGPRRKH